MKKNILSLFLILTIFLFISCTPEYKDCPYKGAVPGIVYVYSSGKYIFYKNQVQIAVWTAQEGKGFIKTGENINGIAREYYENGNNLKSEAIILNNQFNFIQNVYFINGVIWKQYTYKNDILEGEYKEYYQNGNLKSEYWYSEGKLSGQYKEYYEGGQLMEEGKYINGEKYITRKYVYTPTATLTAVFSPTPVPQLNNAFPLPAGQATSQENKIQYIIVTATATQTPYIIYIAASPTAILKSAQASGTNTAVDIPISTSTRILPEYTNTPLSIQETCTPVPVKPSDTPLQPGATYTQIPVKTVIAQKTRVNEKEPECIKDSEKVYDYGKHEKKETKTAPVMKNKVKETKDEWKREYHEKIMDVKEDEKETEGEVKEQYKKEEAEIKKERKEELEKRKKK